MRFKLTRPGGRARTIWRWVAAIFFVVAGMGHFLNPDFYLQIMPPYLPAPKALVVISGACEIAGGIGLLIAPLRRAAGWGLIALLIAVLPANIFMVQHPEKFHIAAAWLWLRLPFQLIFIVWIWWVAIRRAPNFSDEKKAP